MNELLEALMTMMRYHPRAQGASIEDGELRLYWDSTPAVVRVSEGEEDWRPSW
jgi:hypothetical protein